MQQRFDFQSFRSLLNKAQPGHRGQTLVEYSLILALVTIVVVAVLGVLGGQLQNIFSKITSMLT